MNAYEWGIEHESCSDALEARKALGPDATQADWWTACSRGDWLIWQLERLPKSKYNKIKPALKQAIDVIADRAVRNHALPCPETHDWAVKWLSGEDRTQDSASWAAWAARAAWADRAACAARAACASWADSAAWAARAACASWAAWADSAAWADWADSAARAAELKLQATDIHRFIPDWPGKEKL